MSATMFLSPTMLSDALNFPKKIHSLNPTQTTSEIRDTNNEFKLHPSSIPATKTAPWMKGPLVLEPNQVIDFSKPKTRNKSSSSDNNKNEKAEKSLTHKVSGGRGKHAMKKILYSIDTLEQENQESEDTNKNLSPIEFDLSLGKLVKESDSVEKRRFIRKLPWEREERMVFRRTQREKTLTAADITLNEELLQRLRDEGRKMKKWVKVKKAGVHEGVVEQIRLIWKTDELAMLKFDMPLCRNMDRAREILEIKTGGFVIWTKKDTLVVYRGCDYREMRPGVQEFPSCNEKTTTVQGSLYEREADRLLDGLGPRFVDWWMPKPLPIDADLLPETVPGYKPPSRLSLVNVPSKLTDNELTHLRKQAYHFPTHFVLGRNQNLQGLASAILKLWEKCHTAKIAVKWGIPNTNNEQMASELKILTGGVLLLRNKFYIILYRGKDFLPPTIADMVSNREMELRSFQLVEETARSNINQVSDYIDEPLTNVTTVGTLKEFEIIQSKHYCFNSGISDSEVKAEAEKVKLEKEIRNQERKYFILKMKINKASKELMKLSSACEPTEPNNEDQEIMTSEERECFRKMGLKMDSTLLLGRRGVFDGVIEGMHQHWKHREIVKVVTMQRVFSRVLYTAQCVEAESGGILVSIEKLKLGYGIIVYRGKNYKRPLKISRRNLLTKREALQKSLEMQRIGSLKFFANMRQQAIYELKCKLASLGS